MSDDPEPTKIQRVPGILETRKTILRKIIKGPEEERKVNVQLANRKFFDEDLTIGRKKKTEESREKKIGNEEPRDREEGRNIFEMALKLVAHMPERRRAAGKTLTVWYLENLLEWLEENGKEAIQKEFLTENIQKEAVYRGSTDKQFSKLISKVFDVSEETLRNAVEDTMRDLLEKKMFKEAADYAILNQIVDNFSFEQLIVPLLLGDKNQVAYEVLNVSKKMQKAYATLFDEFTEMPDEQMDEYFEPFKRDGIVVVSLERFRRKSASVHLQKFFTTIVKQYKYDLVMERDAPKLDKSYRSRALRYLINSRFLNGNMSDVLYFQHIDGHLRNCSSDIVSYFLDYMWTSEDRVKQVDAIFWVKHLECPKSLQPPSIIQFLENPDREMIEEVEAVAKIRDEHVFPSDGEQLFTIGSSETDRTFPINIAKSEEDLDSLCSKIELLENNVEPVYVGFDSEWKPAHLTEPNTSRIALVQLFFSDEAWLIDYVALEALKIADEKWLNLSHRLFGSSNVRLVGFDVKNDIDAFLTIPAIRDVLRVENIQNVYCTKKLTEEICEIDIRVLELEKKSFKLSELSDKLLGIKLDKSEQCSNWLSRPLRKNQIIYAAMDAVVVVQIFHRVFEMIKEKGAHVDIDQLMVESNMASSKKEEGRRRWRRLSMVSWKEIYETLHTHRNPKKPLTRPADLKFIADTMVIGTGKNLKYLGFDVYLPKNNTDFQEALCKIKETKEQRYIVTVFSKSYDSLRPDYDDLLIVMPDVYNQSVMEQLIEIFDQFNIDIRVDDDTRKKLN